MTTRLTKPVAREVTPVVAKRPPLIVTLDLSGITFRVKGSSEKHSLPYEIGYLRAANLTRTGR